MINNLVPQQYKLNLNNDISLTQTIKYLLKIYAQK